ncbi:hypothetical protein AALP_AAs63807U000100 [Arabis alpina]|uniref:DUF4220 domain-containing protein n=1 Tax=Arabis alpina TaxID=50452 RepID=A0A087G1C8_ARAAL|nr:hypothetical protein AALP_AAs63807U000100 [Arabis alpina]
MGEAIPKEVKDLWDKWNIRGLVILTNWAAEYAVGQIAESQGDEPQPKNNDLLAFWATFLLLHLGGPDTITALALEDNGLWLRNLFGLACQASVTLYVFLLSIPNNLLVPTSLMLVAGIIKYVERIKALSGANLENFKDSMLGEPDPGPDYARLMEEYSTRKRLREPTRIVRIEEVERGQRPNVFMRPNRKLTELEVVQCAYRYFNIFKGLVVDLVFSSNSEQWNNSKEFFLSLKPEEADEALRILEVELSFIYGTFFTKVDILHTRIGVAFRFTALASLVSSLCIFTTAKKQDYNSFDVGLTYALLTGGIALDFVAIFIFCVSDWTFARFKKPKEYVRDQVTRVEGVLNWLLDFRKLKWKEYDCSQSKEFPQKHLVLDRKFIFRRWSEYIYAYNLIGYSMGIKPNRIHKTKGSIHGFFDAIICRLYIDLAIRKISSFFRTIKQKTPRAHRSLENLIISFSTKNHAWNYALYPFKLLLKFWFGIPMINYVLDFFGISDQLNAVVYTSRDRITKEMWEFIFKEVKRRSETFEGAESASGIYSTRGEWVLGETSVGKGTNLLHSVTQVDYDQSILMWHMATELLYQTEEVTQQNQSNREFSKILSDYMMYLLIVQPALMSTVAGIDKIRFMEAVAEAKNFPEVKKFLLRKRLENLRDVNQACKEILSSVDDLKERKGKRYQRRNVLADASSLAKALKQLNGDMMWQVMSKVWVEMLCYAATHCDPKQHVALLSRGGEFLSFVWLLMAHFGLGDQFHATEENARARLVLAK